MKSFSLDSIVRSKLLQLGYSNHWYLQFLKYAADGLRELSFDSLKNVRTVKLTLSDYSAVTLPCDFVDMVRVGAASSDFLKPFAKRGNLNRLNNLDSTGKKVAYDVEKWNGTSWSSLGFSYGGWFGIGGGTTSNSYKILRERGEIQFSNYNGTEIILEYISDGSDADAATQIHPYAQATIEAYIIWQMRQNSRAYSDGEKANAQAEFNRQHKKLRARLSDITPDDLRRVFNNSYNATLP